MNWEAFMNVRVLKCAGLQLVIFMAVATLGALPQLRAAKPFHSAGRDSLPSEPTP
jgi:hypothetical protein